jgi:hypothetical protein
MLVPPNWRTGSISEPVEFGNDPKGRYIHLHSLAVAPGNQGSGYGTTLLKGLIEKLKDAESVNGISILTYDRLVTFYEKAGFRNHGKSACKFGGVDWNDMVSKPEHFSDLDMELIGYLSRYMSTPLIELMHPPGNPVSDLCPGLPSHQRMSCTSEITRSDTLRAIEPRTHPRLPNWAFRLLWTKIISFSSWNPSILDFPLDTNTPCWW